MVDSTKRVFSFSKTSADADATMRNALGGKGANLQEMARMGFPIPAGFTIDTATCIDYYDHDQTFPDGTETQVLAALSRLEADTGKQFGGDQNPLLVSVRSGARASMPGMMDTVLNLGLNEKSAAAMAAYAGDRFAYDSWRRFIQMYSNVVLGMSHGHFEGILDDYKLNEGVTRDKDLSGSDWKAIAADYLELVARKTGKPFPHDPMEQLWGAIRAVFDSWNNDRAIRYREINNIPHAWGTAVTVQSMVFGNMGETSATGVAFTRDPSTGENVFYGEFLTNAQGEDVVAGIRTPVPILKSRALALNSKDPSMEEIMPDTYGQLRDIAARLEAHYKDMQDLEFTIEKGELFILQTRNGKRTAAAALKTATDMVDEGIITKEEALLRVDAQQIDQLLHPRIATDAPREIIVKGLNASPGAAVGAAVFDSDVAEKRANAGEAVILIRHETSPDDIKGMHAAKAIVTARGGLTSHAAVVARGMGRPCICGASEIMLMPNGKGFRVGHYTINEGDIITVDGGTGEVMLGALPLVNPEMSGEFSRFLSWADEVRRLTIRANAETPTDVAQALALGAEGIGLCRTEHMFFDSARIAHVRAMILAETPAERREALTQLLPAQRADFVAIFNLLEGKPANIRLLDPPLHEFLPHKESEFEDLSKNLGKPISAVRRVALALTEANPMLGHRGCRLGIVFPEIYDMQTRAIIEAGLKARADTGIAPDIEIMIPLVAARRELEILKANVQKTAESVYTEQGAQPLNVVIGTMIELPRAALIADQLAESAEFFSFGTNDLTQTTLGISRDDSGGFLNHYVKQGIYTRDPFMTIDKEGVGAMVKLARDGARKTRPDIKLGVCGEHGGDDASINFFHGLGLDYVSCSAWRVPIARLAAAQAVLKE